jgi:hypothetical protein
MISFLFTFLDVHSTRANLLAINVFNVLVILFFLQGLAVVEQLFQLLRAGRILRWVSYCIVVLQLFLFVSVVGFVDYWLDFRKRFSKFKPAETN